MTLPLTVTGEREMLSALRAMGVDQVRDGNGETTLLDDIADGQDDEITYLIEADCVTCIGADGLRGAVVYTFDAD